MTRGGLGEEEGEATQMEARARVRLFRARKEKERGRGEEEKKGGEREKKKEKKEIIWKIADTRYTRGICREPLALCHAAWFEGGRGEPPRERGWNPPTH